MVDEPLTTPVRLREADPSRDFYVYHLLDERGSPFYAGRSKSVQRYARHLEFARTDLARNSQIEKNEIIVRMLDAGLEPGFRKIAEGLTQDEGHALEREEIARIGRLCLGTGPLTNNHDGGGVEGGHFRSQAAQARALATRASTYAARREEAAGLREIRNAERAAKKALSPPKVHKQRQSNRLTARKVETAKPGHYCDGHGLWLTVAPSGARKWVFRFSISGRVTEMGLGNAAVSLAQAREKVAEARKLVAAGVNPIAARREAGRLKAGMPTFGQCADALLAAKSSEWRSERHRQQWKVTLETYAAPLRSRSVDEIDTEAVLSVLQPVWRTTPETAARLRGRIEAVLDAARAKGYIPRNEANPARWRGHLDKLLAKRQKLTRGHHAAMAFDDVPAFIGKLREREAVAAFALEFLILTAARSGEVLGARWAEFDLDAEVWTIPAARMKAGREHRVPLSGRALAILAELAAARTGDFVFLGNRGKPLSGGAMTAVLRRMGVRGCTIHGYRSAFRDWASEITMFQREVVEQCLAHAVGDAVERAYRRGDILEKRRAVLEAWAQFIELRTGSNVIHLTRQAT